MPEKDDKIRREVLKELYDLFKDSPHRRWDGTDIVEELSSDFDESDIVYNVERMDGEYVDNRASLGEPVSIISISSEGIEELYSQGFDTILDSDTRYKILQILYQDDRQNIGYSEVKRTDLQDQLDATADEIDQNIWYLKEKRLIETSGGGGGVFYRSAQITDRGKKRYEQYDEDGVGIPRASGTKSLRQASIGPGESGKAENLFRDFVELSQEEVVIIDPYARKPLYDLLSHVPPGVDIKVITSDTVTGGDYVEAVSEFKEDHEDIEVKDLPSDNWEFHDRYVIRDRDDAWAWGHSFHDAGDTQHTASELKPVNRERVLSLFDRLWEEGDDVV